MFPGKVINTINQIRTYFLLYYTFTTLVIIIFASILIGNNSFIENEDSLFFIFLFLSFMFIAGLLFFVAGCYSFVKIIARKIDRKVIRKYSKNFLIYTVLSIPKEICILTGIYFFIIHSEFDELFFARFVNFYIVLTITIIQIFYYWNSRNYTNVLDIFTNELKIRPTAIISKTALFELIGYVIILSCNFLYMTITWAVEIEPTETPFYEMFNITWNDFLIMIINFFLTVAIIMIIISYLLRIYTGIKLRTELKKVEN